MTKRSSDRKTALITGASSGIGYELARVFAKEGHNTVLVARHQEALEVLARELQERYSVSAIVVPADLSDPSAPDRIRSVLMKESVPVDYLANNAGFALRGTLPGSGSKVLPEYDAGQHGIASTSYATLRR